jgi:hypothetical protein
MKVESRAGLVSVRLRPPSPLAALRGALELKADARVEAP